MKMRLLTWITLAALLSLADQPVAGAVRASSRVQDRIVAMVKTNPRIVNRVPLLRNLRAGGVAFDSDAAAIAFEPLERTLRIHAAEDFDAQDIIDAAPAAAARAAETVAEWIASVGRAAPLDFRQLDQIASDAKPLSFYGEAAAKSYVQLDSRTRQARAQRLQALANARAQALASGIVIPSPVLRTPEASAALRPAGEREVEASPPSPLKPGAEKLSWDGVSDVPALIRLGFPLIGHEGPMTDKDWSVLHEWTRKISDSHQPIGSFDDDSIRMLLKISPVAYDLMLGSFVRGRDNVLDGLRFFRRAFELGALSVQDTDRHVGWVQGRIGLLPVDLVDDPDIMDELARLIASKNFPLEDFRISALIGSDLNNTTTEPLSSHRPYLEARARLGYPPLEGGAVQPQVPPSVNVDEADAPALKRLGFPLLGHHGPVTAAQTYAVRQWAKRIREAGRPIGAFDDNSLAILGAIEPRAPMYLLPRPYLDLALSGPDRRNLVLDSLTFWRRGGELGAFPVDRDGLNNHIEAMPADLIDDPDIMDEVARLVARAAESPWRFWISVPFANGTTYHSMRLGTHKPYLDARARRVASPLPPLRETIALEQAERDRRKTYGPEEEFWIEAWTTTVALLFFPVFWLMRAAETHQREPYPPPGRGSRGR